MQKCWSVEAGQCVYTAKDWLHKRSYAEAPSSHHTAEVDRGNEITGGSEGHWGESSHPHTTYRSPTNGITSHLTPCVNSIENVGLGRWGVEWKPYHQPHHTSWSDNRWGRGNVCSCVHLLRRCNILWVWSTYLLSYTAHSHNTVQ